MNSSSHIVCVFLMRINSLVQQRQPLCVLLGTITAQLDISHVVHCTFFIVEHRRFIGTCLAGSCMAWTNCNDCTVVARIASVRPYLNILNDALS